MEVTKIDFADDNVAEGRIFLFKNCIGNKGKYFARFERKTINDDIIIARIHERGVGLDDLTVKAVIGLYKKEVVAALGRGESINLMDLGRLYIRATGTADSRAAAPSLMSLEPAFTPSRTSMAAVSSVKISGASFAKAGPKIEELVDLYTGLSSLSVARNEGVTGDDGVGVMGLSAGKVASLKGSRLKVAGEEGGVFFCPLDGEGNPLSDRSRYVKVAQEKLSRNRDSVLEFFLPPTLEKGVRYRILVRTNYLSRKRSLRNYREVYSEPLLISEAE